MQRNLAAGTTRELARELARKDGLDADEVIVHPVRRVVQAVGFSKGRRDWIVIDPSIADDFAALAKLSDGDFTLVSRDRADRTWLVAFSRDRGPIRYYTWDRRNRLGTFLFVHRPKLESVALAEMRPIVVTARDGLELNGYLTDRRTGGGRHGHRQAGG